MTEIKPQQENIKELLRLVQENPDLRIVPFVDTEVVGGDDYSSWVGSWGKASVDEILLDDGRLCIKSEDLERLVNDLMCTSEKILSKAEAEEIVNNYIWGKVIVVRIGLPY